MKKYTVSLMMCAPLVLAACGDKPASETAPAQVETPVVVEAVEIIEAEKPTTAVTEENYALAESQVIFVTYVQRIAAASGTNGVGILQHNKVGADPGDRTITRINFDTIYSMAVVDLTEYAVLTLPETNGRYQSAWIITDEHYNPMAFVKPGTYTLTQENVGSRCAFMSLRKPISTATG